MSAGPSGFYGRFGKRALECAAVAGALLALSPLLALLWALVRWKLGCPALFRQDRPGRFGVPFRMLKFRTMTDACGPDGQLLSDGERLTPFGALLRQTSLDELPELVNVLKGEMSLVGPRPLLMRYYPFFTQEERRRFEVRPGITGLAQVSGRNDLPWEERFALDVRYVRELSFALDLKILLMTVWRTVGRHGLRVDPGATMPDLDALRGGKPPGEVGP